MPSANRIFPYTVTRLEWMTPSVFRLVVAPKEGTVFDFKAGQFVMLRLFNADGTFWKQRAFSICSSPRTKRHLELGIKRTGEFTSRAATLAVGSRVAIAGPYGRFTLQPEMRAVTMLAGGIGIAPFLSMLRSAEERSDTAMTLVYCNSTPAGIAYRTELDALARSCPWLHVRYFVSRGADGGTVGQGRLDDAFLDRVAPPEIGRHYLLCGPEGFMDAARAFYRSRGVPDDFVRFERF